MATVLVVDDSADNRYYLQALLQGHGLNVAEAADGAAALALARQQPPDLVISDILMPRMDGYQLCRAFRADAALRAIPFIFYTATFTSDRDAALGLQLGADRFLLKPQEPEVLLAEIRTLLAQAAAPAPVPDEGQLAEEYGAVLFRKLEKKMAELERANAALRQNEERFRAFLQQCPVALAVSAASGVVELVNSAFVDLLGYGLADLQRIDDWWPRAYPDPAYRARVQQRWQQALSEARLGGGLVQPAGEFRVCDSAGQTHDLRISATFVGDRLLTLFQDLTAIRAAERERALLHSQMMQQDKMACVGQLAAGIAHEVNNPAGFIHSNLESLDRYLAHLRRYFDQEQVLLAGTDITGLPAALAALRHDCHIDAISRQLPGLVRDSLDGIERIVGIVRDLRLFSHRDSRQLEALDLLACLEGVINIVWGEIKKSAQLERQLQPLPAVRGNSQQLSQVLMNLLVNAAQAIDKPGGRIVLRSWREADRACLAVEDNGCGMEETLRARIFEPFFTTKPAGQGTGLGLPISLQIVEAHQGQLRVDSQPGRGSCFTLCLPLAQADHKENP
ncbi:ATP-binding protein [Desulfuromonas thiophila]|uniref:histidine kinase n=1 Tax=Desulfuromonas thiophila TaxID=57664 RepID=A0A1G6X6E6_9BACT|nr:ATP-binding protein [Desulfuromonas thiophila]SDD73698.1 PAS domain S-box-containing protein [Desulfuromonas thiophila]